MRQTAGDHDDALLEGVGVDKGSRNDVGTMQGSGNNGRELCDVADDIDANRTLSTRNEGILRCTGDERRRPRRRR